MTYPDNSEITLPILNCLYTLITWMVYRLFVYPNYISDPSLNL